jgi:putative endonuclease
MSRRARRRAWRRGRRGERLAAWWLRLKGYRILARDFRSAVGEIDLVARRGRLLALVEVKARPSLAEAGEAIGRHQRERIGRAAKAFLQRHPSLGTLDLRFDAVLIVPGRWPRHVPDAWREELRF